jgi:hypothetical protein
MPIASATGVITVPQLLFSRMTTMAVYLLFLYIELKILFIGNVGFFSVIMQILIDFLEYFVAMCFFSLS